MPSERERDEIISENCEYTSKLGYSVSDEDRILPVMYWIPKMHKTPIGHRFIVASKLCCTKKVSKAVSSALKLVFWQVESFHRKAKIDSPYSKFWVLQNVDPVIEKLKHINKRKMRNLFQHMILVLYTPKFHMKIL